MNNILLTSYAGVSHGDYFKCHTEITEITEIMLTYHFDEYYSIGYSSD